MKKKLENMSLEELREELRLVDIRIKNIDWWISFWGATTFFFLGVLISHIGHLLVDIYKN